MNSILNTVKQMCNVAQFDEAFDGDLIVYINSVFTILNQLGVGPKDGFSITDDTTTWDDYLSGDISIELVKSYVPMKVKLMFDPPQNGSALENLKELVAESEWRLNVAKDRYPEEE